MWRGVQCIASLSVTPEAPVQCTAEGEVVSVGRFALISSSCTVYSRGKSCECGEVCPHQQLLYSVQQREKL